MSHNTKSSLSLLVQVDIGGTSKVGKNILQMQLMRKMPVQPTFGSIKTRTSITNPRSRNQTALCHTLVLISGKHFKYVWSDKHKAYVKKKRYRDPQVMQDWKAWLWHYCHSHSGWIYPFQAWVYCIANSLSHIGGLYINIKHIVLTQLPIMVTEWQKWLAPEKDTVNIALVLWTTTLNMWIRKI